MNLRLFFSGLLLFLVVFNNTEAQKHPQFRYVSLDAGLNMSGIHSESGYDRHKKNTGVNIGLSGNYSFSDSRSLGATITFEQKGAVDNVYDINTNLNYISLPVYMKWVTGKEPRLYFVTGAYVAWLIDATRKGDYTLGGQLLEVNEKVTSEFRPLDYGLVAGAGLMVRLYDDFDFVISLGGSAGLADIAAQPGTKAGNFQLNFRLGYIYYIGFR